MVNAIRIAIVGGGIGGLSTAIALRSRGMSATVFEQAAELKEVGAGLGVAPNAARLLIRAGFKARLDEVGVMSTGLTHKKWTGEPIPGISSSLGRNVYLCHRADFLKALVERLPAGSVRLGHRLSALAQSSEKVTLHFENGETYDADLVIGADGLHSLVRSSLGLESSPRSEFIMAYRAMVPIEKLPWAKGVVGATSWLGPGRSVMCYPVSAGRQINLVAFVPTDLPIAESWSARAQVNALVAEFEGWDPTVLETIAAAEEMFRTGIYDREALPYWSDGRVTLLGDAAHAMVPHLGQGASQAIEDAFALAAMLQNAQSGDVPGLLKRYEQLRLPRTSRVQNLAREAGQLFRAREAQAKRDEQMRSVLNDLDWLFTYDAEAAATDAAQVRR